MALLRRYNTAELTGHYVYGYATLALNCGNLLTLLKVASSMQKATSDRSLAENDVDVNVIGVHVSKTSASLVQDGMFYYHVAKCLQA